MSRRAAARRHPVDALAAAGVAATHVSVAAGRERRRAHRDVRTGVRRPDRGADRARRRRDRIWRRRRRRSRQLLRCRGAARSRLRAGADHAAGPGRLLGRRQDRDPFASRQEPDRRVPPAGSRGRGHRAARHPVGAPVPRAGYARVAKYGLLGDAAFFGWLEAQRRRCVRRPQQRARACHRGELPHEGRDRRPHDERETPATARCSTSATPSATPSRRPPGFPTACCTAKRSRSA